jgi:hypothetical protein
MATVRRLWGIFLGVGLLAASGCITRESLGDEVVYSFPTWMVVLTVVAGVAAVPVGWLVTRKNRLAGWMVMVLGPPAAGLFAPMLASDRVAFDADHFEARYGFWWSPSEFNIRFADVQEIRWVTKEGSSRGRQTYSHFLDCVMKSGRTQQVSVGTVMQEAVDEILARARARGVPVIGRPES